ncbi:MAG: sensor hybrid histidine kinase [Verrucomicrobiales bacterium]|nr:sensor hybrid histidine kinase [Verrucomicrobiales bacterium]
MTISTAQRLQVLHLEDNLTDRDLVQRWLKQGNLNCQIRYAQTELELRTALLEQTFDVVLGDQTLPGFDGIAALKIVKERHPDLPFIFVTGSMGEEAAIETMRLGATDYVLKDRSNRLASTVDRAITEARTRKERQRAAEEIKEMAALLDQASDAIVVCDLENKIRYWNRGAERVYGWSSQEVIGKDLGELLAKDLSPRFMEARERVLTEGEWDGEFLYFSKSEKIVITRSHWTLVRDDQGRPKTIFSINADITEKKQLEAQYLRAQRMESLGILAGGIAHDLNNVLSPVLMVSQLLRMQATDTESLEFLDTIENSANRGASLIKQILSFARGVEGEHLEIQVGHLMRDLQKMLRETLPRSIKVDVNVAQGLWTTKGVPTHLQQVMMNLCVNARDAMPNGGKLSLSATNIHVDETYQYLHRDAKPGDYVVISISDTGIGIAPEVLKHIYEPFFRTKTTGKGTGLGLSTVKSILKNHNGFLHVQSETGKGSCFRAHFPAQIPANLQPLEKHQPNLPRGNGEGILVVDDETAVVAMTRKVLERYGYQVFTATDGAEGVATFLKEQSRIHLVMCDVMMPIMDGAAMIRAVRKLDPSTRFIILTGLPENHKISEVNQAEPIEILRKPYSSEELLITLQKVLQCKPKEV